MTADACYLCAAVAELLVYFYQVVLLHIQGDVGNCGQQYKKKLENVPSANAL